MFSRKVADFLAKILPHRDIVKPEGLYLRRFYLTPRRWPIRIFLHYIGLSDVDTDLHDHPWSFVTVILSGGYNEELPCKFTIDWREVLGGNVTRWSTYFKRRRAGSIIMHHATDSHKVHLVNGKPSWSLVFSKRAVRNWGFKTGMEGWTDWRTYLNLPNQPDHLEDEIYD